MDMDDVDTLTQLRTLDEETLEPPDSRVGSAGSIRSRIAEMKQADTLRSPRRSKMQGIIDGNRPFIQQQLDNTGQGDRTNLNLREAEGMADAAKTPYFSLIFRVPRFTNIQTGYGDQPQRRVEWNEIISEEWHQMLDDWNGYDFQTQLAQWQMCVFGVGMAMWPDTRDWRWEARKISDVLVPDDTEADIDKLDEGLAFRWKSPVDLYQKVKNEEAAKIAGWFPERVKRAIVEKKTSEIVQRYGEDWSEEWQNSLRCGDILWNNKALRIPLADYLVKEYDGSITHVIMLDDGGVSGSSILDDDDDAGLLFKKVGCFDSFDQVLCPFFFDIGTGGWHSIKGLGPKISDFCEVSNRLGCSAIDGARNGASILLKAKDGKSAQATQLISVNGATIIPPDCEIQQNKFADSLQGTLAVVRHLSGILQSNTGQYRERMAQENQEPTLGQAKLNYQNQAQLNDSAIDRYMKSLDRMYREMVRRALNPRLSKSDPGGKEALAFRDRCVKRGVPPEALLFKNIISVKAVRGVGGGSPVAQSIAADGLMQMMPMMNEIGRRNAQRTKCATLVGQSNVDAYFPPFGEAELPDDNVWHAAVENGQMRKADDEVPPVTPKQDHVIHINEHFKDAAEDVQMLQAGQRQPMDTLIHLHKAGPHIKEHLDEMAGDPTRKDQLKAMTAQWQGLAKVQDQLQQHVQESMQAQQKAQPPPMDPKLVSAMAQVQGDLQNKRTKIMGDLQLKKEKQDAMAQLKDLEVAHKLRLKTLAQTSRQVPSIARRVPPNRFSALPVAQ